MKKLISLLFLAWAPRIRAQGFGSAWPDFRNGFSGEYKPLVALGAEPPQLQYPDTEEIVKNEHPRVKLPKIENQYKKNDTARARYNIATMECGRDALIMDRNGWMKLGNDTDQLDMFFWYWEAKYVTEETPVILYLAGGPGMSGMLSMFDNTGPCIEIKGRSYMNPWSFTDDVDVIYVDHPIPVGWSIGDEEIGTRERAVDLLYEFLQQYLREWPQYRRQRFGIWTVDYASHIGLGLAQKILKENEKMFKERKNKKEDKKDLKRKFPIKLTSIGMDSPHIDLAVQHKSAIEFARKNDVKRILLEDDYEFLKTQWETQYQERFQECVKSSTKADCASLLREYQIVWRNLTEGWGPEGPRPRPDYDFLDIRGWKMDNSPEAYKKRLQKKSIKDWFHKMQKKYDIYKGDWYPKDYQMIDTNVTRQFWDSLDVLKSSAETLDFVVNAGVKTLIFGGDADLLTNWMGLKEIVENVKWDFTWDIKNQPTSQYFASSKLHADKEGAVVYPAQYHAAEIKKLHNLVWMKVFDAGHYVAEYQPNIVVEIFKEHIWGKDATYPGTQMPMPLGGCDKPDCTLKPWRCDFANTEDCLGDDYRGTIEPPTEEEIDY